MDDKDGREKLKIKVLMVVLSPSPSIIIIEAPTSLPEMTVRELFCSTLYQVIDGLGLAVALHTNTTLSGCITVIVVSLINGGSRGAEIMQYRFSQI